MKVCSTKHYNCQTLPVCKHDSQKTHSETNKQPGVQQYAKKCIEIYCDMKKTRIAIHIAIHLVSLFLSITALSSVLLHNARVMKLASMTHYHIFSYSLCPSTAFSRRNDRVIAFPF